MKRKDIIIKSKRLLLKATSINDAVFLVELLNTPKWLKYIGDRGVKTTQDSEDYITTKIRPQIEKLGYGNYTVVRKTDGVKVGTCGLYDREGLEGVDIGFAFLPEYEKQGYAYESSKKLLEVGFSNFSIKLVNAITMPSNKASQRLLEKLDLSFKKMIKLPHDENELMLYQKQNFAKQPT
ncbi:Acetyltransferase, GNAT family [hydrothermal vent metagenome]|uniref:Acetyltransferase, GNAT family n=1 Tax=hydrothermal vent metagenome TaxID=652676 RepID=A0A3B0VCY5_9ZZZZ